MDHGVENFIDIFVDDMKDVPADAQDWQEVFLAEDVKEGSGVEEESGEEGELVIDVAQCVEVKGDAENGYYLEFAEGIEEELEDLYNQSREKYENAGIFNSNKFKELIKAEIATEFPNFGRSSKII